MLKQNLYHISDTIQISKKLESHDITVDRIKLTYEALKDHLGIDNSEKEIYIGSEVGNSYQTGSQVISILKDLPNDSNTKIIMANNASRSKFINKKDSEASSYLWAILEINNIVHHVVGVDDEVFSIFIPFLKEGTDIKKINGLIGG